MILLLNYVGLPRMDNFAVKRKNVFLQSLNTIDLTVVPLLSGAKIWAI